MVQLKYFGDDRDYFKYDLIMSIFQAKLLNSYVFIPMLTKARDGNEGNRRPINNGDKSQELYDFIMTRRDKSLNHWETWLVPYVSSYYTIKPTDEVFFYNESRAEYWRKYAVLMNISDILIFLDPDTGLQTGQPNYRKRKGPEKYILNDELKDIIKKLHPESILMIYQHLPNNKYNHVCSTRKKLEQVQSVCSNVRTCAYREDDLAFIFVAKTEFLFMKLLLFLKKYYKESKHQRKSIVELQNE
jgi:hypothetical protein